jgi:hypothetical protein
MGLMHRVLDLQTKTPDSLKVNQSHGVSRSVDTQSIEENQSILEELLVQALQSIPLCPDGFMGMYQTFHLLRDLFGFEKLVFLSPSLTQDNSLEPLIHYGMQPGSLLHMQIKLEKLDHSKRYFLASSSLLEVLTPKDRESVESPYFCIQVGLQKPLGLLIGSSPFTSQDPQGILAFGPIAQLLDIHSPRFLDFTHQTNRSIPFSIFLDSLKPDTYGLEIHLELLLQQYKDHYSDVIEHQIRWILRQWLEFFLPEQGSFSWNDQGIGYYMFPEANNAVYLAIIDELKRSLMNQFGLECSDLSIQITPIKAMFSPS